jgi:hypothetical membrane protein
MNLKNTNWLKISGVCGILTPIVAFTFISLAIISFPQFSWTDNALSDLGVQEGVTSVPFNSGLIIGAFLALIFASGLFILQKKILGRIGVFIFALAGLALMAIGIFTENFEPTHYYASVALFLLLFLSTLVIGPAFMLEARVKMGLFTFLAAAVVALVWAVQWTIGFGSNVAIPETLSGLSASAWTVMLSFKMLREASRLRN